MLVTLGILSGLILALGLAVLITKLILFRQSVEDIVSKNKSILTDSTPLIKKYPQANVNQYQGLFMRVGLMLSLSFVIMAFSWRTYDGVASLDGPIILDEEFEIIPPNSNPLPPPPPPAPPVINEVPDEVIIEDVPEFELEDMEPTTMLKTFEAAAEEIDEEKIYFASQVSPQFPGGEAGLFRYIQQIKYPEIAKTNGIEGIVYLSFVVDKTGKVTRVKLLRGTNKLLDKAAIEHIKNMPAWRPGLQAGKAVNVQFSVPIKFVLD